MARITVEDCLEQIPNRFQLVLAATYRARMLSQGRQDRSGNAQEGAGLIHPVPAGPGPADPVPRLTNALGCV